MTPFRELRLARNPRETANPSVGLRDLSLDGSVWTLHRVLSMGQGLEMTGGGEAEAFRWPSV